MSDEDDEEFPSGLVMDGRFILIASLMGVLRRSACIALGAELDSHGRIVGEQTFTDDELHDLMVKLAAQGMKEVFPNKMPSVELMKNFFHQVMKRVIEDQIAKRDREAT